MTEKEKAKEIYDKMKGFRVTNKHRKKCARVAVEEIIKSIHEISEPLINSNTDIEDENWILTVFKRWEGVKSEIEKL